MGSDPDVPTADDRCRAGRLPPRGVDQVIERRENDVVADLAAVSDRHPSVVLEVAAGVDEDLPAQVDVLTEVGVEGREDPQRGIDPAAEQLREQCADLIGGVIFGVQAAGDAPGLVAHLVHQAQHFGLLEGFALLCVLQEFVECHLFSFGFAVLRGPDPALSLSCVAAVVRCRVSSCPADPAGCGTCCKNTRKNGSPDYPDSGFCYPYSGSPFRPLVRILLPKSRLRL